MLMLELELELALDLELALKLEIVLELELVSKGINTSTISNSSANYWVVSCLHPLQPVLAIR